MRAKLSFRAHSALRSFVSVAVIASGVSFGLAACRPEESVNHRGEALAGGVAAPTETGVFLVQSSDKTGALCSGVLVTPRLVLTAAHCLSGAVASVDCAKSRFPSAAPSAQLQLTNLADMTIAPSPTDRYFSATPVSFPGGELLCGADWALLELSEAVPPEVAKPMRFDLESVAAGLDVVAVGYGAGHSAGTGEGIRRRSMNATVDCVGASCDGVVIEGAAGASNAEIPTAIGGEFAVRLGACPGDSGAPVLDSGGVVRGVLSRGSEDCGAAIVTPISRAMADEVARVSAAIGEPSPAWTETSEPMKNLGGVAGAPTISSGGAREVPKVRALSLGGGCSMSRERNDRVFPLALMLGAVMLMRRKKLSGRVAVSLVSLGLLGCSTEYSDSEARKFKAVCEKGACLLRENGAESVAFRVNSDSQVLTVCPAGDSPDYECRPLVCDTDRQCQFPGADGFACLDGICRHESRKKRTRDVIAECLSGTGVGMRTAQQRERLTLARACGEKCGLPEVCASGLKSKRKK